MSRALTLLLVLGIGGCALQSGDTSYYGGKWDPPTISSLSETSEAGNTGGGVITIDGGGFGDKAGQIVVVFGDENAELVSVTPSQITLIVPPGPITGGGVDVRVATATGYSSAPDPYVYDVGGLYEKEVGYVQVNNFWDSCLGGLSDRLDDTYGRLGCNTISYTGTVGIDGRAEALSFHYPRLHSEQIGFYGGTDQGSPEWVVERPGAGSYASSVQDLHQDIGRIRLRNAFWTPLPPEDGEEAEPAEVCIDLDGLASYRCGGGVVGDDYPDGLDPVTVYGDAIPKEVDCPPAGASDAEKKGIARYQVDEMDWCATTDAEGIPDFVYRPDWPIVENFFSGTIRRKPADVTIEMETEPGVLSGNTPVPLALPASLIVYADEGFDIIDVDQEEGEGGDLWSISDFGRCYDDRGRSETLDDVAISFHWEPSEITLAERAGEVVGYGDARILGRSTYVRFTVTQLSVNWFGGSGTPLRATVVVPDDNALDNDGLSHVEIPASVLYQFPSTQVPQAGGFGGATTLLDPVTTNWGYLIVTAERVTDYSIASELGGDVVFSYATGDFGFFGWANPADADGCHNCIDDDEDGWGDELDPECASGATEETAFGDTACNDGRDNDRDGIIDIEDDLCADGNDGDESNCSDSEDNDLDGLEDALDPDCQVPGNEDTPLPCENDLDDDYDGWVDQDDPDCATEDAEVGFGDGECNDGLDNDGDRLRDAEDPECGRARETEGG